VPKPHTQFTKTLTLTHLGIVILVILLVMC
jgi:hypothetical protein